MDIVERLRKLADGERPYGSLLDVMDEAADEIERLRWENANMEKLWGKSEGTWMEIRDKQDAEIERLREALKLVRDELDRRRKNAEEAWKEKE